MRHYHNPDKPPISQAFAQDRWLSFIERNPGGEDVIAALNMFWAYFKDCPRSWHPAFSWSYSIKHAAAIMGIDWRRNWREMRPRREFKKQMREYGIEESKETGKLEVRNLFRWRHALAIARQTGRCPPSTFELRINDPDCEPSDPVNWDDLPLKKGWKYRRPGRFATSAEPNKIADEMVRVGLRHKTYDARRAKWFSVRANGEQPSLAPQNGASFAQVARRTLERLARG